MNESPAGGESMQENLHRELRQAAFWTIVLDAVLWLASLPFYGIGPEVPLGLLCGSAGELANLHLLRRSIRNAVYYGKSGGMGSYLLRCLVAAAVLAMAMLLEKISTPAAIIPFLYPKLIFGFSAVRSNSEKNGGM
jgi:hypothetical protein